MLAGDSRRLLSHILVWCLAPPASGDDTFSRPSPYETGQDQIASEKECVMKASIRSGATIAVAAAAFILAGAVQAPASAAEPGQGHCMGANACKGQGACQTASNECEG